jgi:hypothetical protein
MDIGNVYTIMRHPELTKDEVSEFRGNANSIIKRPIPKELIKQREGANKMKLSYIEGETVIRLLNEAFGESGWSFQIVNKSIVPAEPKQVTKWNSDTHRADKVFNEDGTPKMEPQPPIVEVLGRLTIPGFGIREQFGTKTLIGGSSEQEGASKSAATDALKKCATLFGIGLELYDDKAPAPQTQTRTQPTYSNTRPAAPQSPAPAKTENPWPPAETEKLKKLKESLHITKNEALNPYVAEFTGNPNATYEMISPTNINSFNKFLEKKFF